MLQVKFGEKVFLYPVQNGTYDNKKPATLASSTWMNMSFPKNVRPGYLKDMIAEWQKTPGNTPVTGPWVHQEYTYVPVNHMGKPYLAQIRTSSIQNGKFESADPKVTEARVPFLTADGKPCLGCNEFQNGSPQTPTQKRETKTMDSIIAEAVNQKRTLMSDNYTSEACYTNFIGRDGKLGVIGKMIVREMERPEYAEFFYNHPQLAKDCPNYHHPSFSKSMKQDYFIHFLAHLSWIESTCGTVLVGKKGEMGAFQLENDRRIGYRKILAQPAVPEITDACVPPIIEHENNVRCTMFNLAAQLRGRFKVVNWDSSNPPPPQPLLTGASSWGPIIESSTRRKMDKPEESRGAFATVKNQTTSFPGCAPALPPAPNPAPAKSKEKKR